MKLFVIVAAAGSGSRAGLGYNKLLHPLGSGTVLQQTLGALSVVKASRTLITSSPTDVEAFNSIAALYNAEVVLGGETRTKSVRNALDILAKNANDDDLVLIHDGARPFVSGKVVLSSMESARLTGSGIPAIPCPDTLVTLEGNAVPRSDYMLVQTPQCFNLSRLLQAYNAAGDKDFSDDSQVYKEYFGSIHFCLGSSVNRKITNPEDFAALPRVGNGYDIHELAADFRPLVLGGIIIPVSKGLLGHSDADVVVHALMDALLSAAGERDIGVHFPNTPEYKDADSIILLQKVLGIIRPHKVRNVALAIIAEKPRLSPYIPDMKNMLARSLGIAPTEVGITVTTAEGLGLVGSQKAIAAYATAMIV